MGYIKNINKRNLQIARENIGLDTVSVSSRITSTNEDIVLSWEKGESLPTWSQVKKLAKLYCISELLFFSNDTLPKNKVVPDYRVGQDSESNFKISKLVNIVESRQQWLRGKLIESGFEKNNLVGSGKHIDNPVKLASFIATKLDIKLQDIKNISGTDGRKATLDYLIRKAEGHGVFVGKTLSFIPIEVKDLRGLFISDEYCPFIILNRRDATSAQIFSLVHELAHLFRQTDAISNSLDFRQVTGINAEETFCNKVAAELLLPTSEFTKNFYEGSDLDQLSYTYKVSKLFIFYRLKELKKIPKEIEESLEREIQRETLQNLQKKESTKAKGGNYTTNMKDSNGKLFNKLVSSFYFENKINYVEASNALAFSAENV